MTLLVDLHLESFNSWIPILTKTLGQSFLILKKPLDARAHQWVALSISIFLWDIAESMGKLHVSLGQSFGWTRNLPTLRGIKGFWIIYWTWDWMPRGWLVEVGELIKVGRDTTQRVTHRIKICLQLLKEVRYRWVECLKSFYEGQKRIWFMIHFFKVVDCVLPLRGSQIFHPLNRVGLL